LRIRLQASSRARIAADPKRLVSSVSTPASSDLHHRLDLPRAKAQRQQEDQRRRREGCDADDHHGRHHVALDREDGTQEIVHHVHRPHDLARRRITFVAPAQDHARFLVVRHGDHRADRMAREVSVEVERGDVLLGDLVVLHDRGVGDDPVTLAPQHRRARLGTRQVLMPVAEPFDDPGRLDVHEDRQIVGPVGALQHAHHVHLEGIHAGQIEDVLRRGDQRIARADAAALGHSRPHDALAQHRHGAAGGEPQSPELEILEGGAQDGVPTGAEARVEGDGFGQARVGDPQGFGVGRGPRWVGLQIQRAQHQLERAALGPHQQRCRLGARRELGGALVHHDLEAHRQVHDQHDRCDEDGRLDAVIDQVAPGQVERLLHAALPGTFRTSITRPKRSSRS
jgi:hypothetical protein